MKQVIISLLVAVALVTSACQKPTAAQVTKALSDAKWGLSEACSQEWVPATECTVGLSAFDTAMALVNQSPDAPAAAQQTLQAVLDGLADGSRLRPYLEVVKKLLA